MVVSPSAQPKDASNETNQKVLQQKILHKVAAMRNIISNNLTKWKAKYELYFDKKLHALLTFTIGQQVDLARPLRALIAEEKKTSKRCNKVLLRTKGPFFVIYVKRHVIIIDEDSIPNFTHPSASATPVPTEVHMNTILTPDLDQPARNTVSHNAVKECEEIREYVADNVVDDRHASEYLIYNYIGTDTHHQEMPANQQAINQTSPSTNTGFDTPNSMMCFELLPHQGRKNAGMQGAASIYLALLFQLSLVKHQSHQSRMLRLSLEAEPQTRLE